MTELEGMSDFEIASMLGEALSKIHTSLNMAKEFNESNDWGRTTNDFGEAGKMMGKLKMDRFTERIVRCTPYLEHINSIVNIEDCLLHEGEPPEVSEIYAKLSGVPTDDKNLIVDDVQELTMAMRPTILLMEIKEHMDAITGCIKELNSISNDIFL